MVADAITWTAENGIFAGYGKDKFGPDDPITREQLAAIFYRYADYKGYDLTVKGDLDKFKDADKITDYAKTAMQWAVGSGLVKGKSGNLLDPQGTATALRSPPCSTASLRSISWCRQGPGV